jgi:periplasmic copper chaperone A
MNDRSRRRPASIRETHAKRLRGALPPTPAPSTNLPRLIGGALLAVALLLIVVGAATAHEFSNKGITVSHPWARATPGGVTVGGAYFEVKAAPGQADRLVGGRSAIAGSVEVHSHSMENGVAKMRKIDGLPIKGGESVVLKPGGYHVMLLDLKQPLKEGDLVKFTLSFEKAGDIEVEATVEPIGAKGPHGFDSQPVSTDKGSGGGHHKH